MSTSSPKLRHPARGCRPWILAHVLPYAELAWADVRRTEGGRLKVEHDHYLKMWQLRGPWLPSEFILLDEAQDTNPAVEAVVLAQRDHAQLALAGDSAQQIYAWRGARDVMAGFDGRQLPLTQSFRFGGALAAEANRWLSLAGAPIRLRGHPAIPTKIGKAGDPDAIVNVIDDLGADTVLAAVTQLAQESDAEVVVSTAHRAKGREWDSVRIAYDFIPPEDAEGGQLKPIPEEFARLAYVAVTRARRHLDLSGLSWIQGRRL